MRICVGAENNALVIQKLTEVLLGQDLVLVYTVLVLAEAVAAHSTPPFFRFTLGTTGMGLSVDGEKESTISSIVVT